MKKYRFKLPEAKQLSVDPTGGSDLVTSQGLPIYAYIPKDCDTESTSPSGGPQHEIECKMEGGIDGGIW